MHFNNSLRVNVMKYIIGFIMMVVCGFSFADEIEIGKVSTKFNLVGSNSSIIVSRFDDPSIPEISCYISYSKQGGISGALGYAEEASEASVSCHKFGVVTNLNRYNKSEEVFNQKRSLLFKHLRVVRMIDQDRRVAVYMTYTDRLIDGSPKNTISTVSLD